MAAAMLSRYEQIRMMYDANGYQFFVDPYALNIFGIRDGYDVVDEFNDVLGIAFVDGFGNPVVMEFKGTTKPGLYYLKKKLGNKNGTAILVPGQYIRCWKFGLHSGKYEALRQNGSPFKVWRDNDSDGEFDVDGKKWGNVTGLNLHTTSFINEIEKVGAYSAGCQVFQRDEDFVVVMALIKKAMYKWRTDIFSYTLFVK
jgi:hypothetical protein